MYPNALPVYVIALSRYVAVMAGLVPLELREPQLNPLHTLFLVKLTVSCFSERPIGWSNRFLRVAAWIGSLWFSCCVTASIRVNSDDRTKT